MSTWHKLKSFWKRWPDIRKCSYDIGLLTSIRYIDWSWLMIDVIELSFLKAGTPQVSKKARLNRPVSCPLLLLVDAMTSLSSRMWLKRFINQINPLFPKLLLVMPFVTVIENPKIGSIILLMLWAVQSTVSPMAQCICATAIVSAWRGKTTASIQILAEGRLQIVFISYRESLQRECFK